MKKNHVRKGVVWLILAALLAGTCPTYVWADNEETTISESGETAAAEQLVTFELGKSYDLSVGPEQTQEYQFQYTPERSAGYNLECFPVRNMNINIQVYDADGRLLSSSGGKGDHYYMLKQQVPYFFKVLVDPQYLAQGGSGQITLSVSCEESECLYISEDGTLTGASDQYYIIYVPEGVKTMKACPYIYGTGTITLPESMESIHIADLWRCANNYFVSGENGRYVSRDGVLYDNDNRTLTAFPYGRRGAYTVAEGTEVIADWAFRGTCLDSLTLPNTVTTLERDFITSDTLKELTLSDNINDVKERFISLYALENIHVSSDNSCFEVRDGVLYRKENGKYSLVYYPLGKKDVEFTIPEDVYAIEGYAFSRVPQTGMEDPVRNLKMLTIPDTVTVMDPSSSIFGYQGNKIPKLKIRGTEGSAAYEYYKNTYEWERNYLSWWVLWDETTDDFLLGRDNNSFLHWMYTNENSGFYGIDGKFYLNWDCRHKLLKSVNPFDIGLRCSLLARIYGTGFSKWNGCCYGIAVTLGSVYNKDLTVPGISNTSEKNVFQLPRPCDDKKYLSVINYYQLTQQLRQQPSFSFGSIQNSNDNLTNSDVQKSSDGEVAALFQGLIHYLDQNKSVVLPMRGSGGGHAVLACDYEYLQDLDMFVFKIYDMNSVSLTEKKGRFTQLKVSGDLRTFDFEELGVSSDNYITLDAIVPSDIDVERPKARTVTESPDTYTTIIVPTENPVTITDSTGKSLMSDGRNWMGDMKIYDMRVIGTGTSENPGSEYIFEVEEGPQYTVSGIEGDVEIQIYNSEGYLSLAGSQITNAKMEPGRTMDIDGNQCQFKAYISANSKDVKGNGGLASVSGNADGSVSLKVLNDTVSVASQGGIANAEAMTYTEEASYEVAFPETMGAGETEEIKIAGMEEPKGASVTIQAGSHMNKTKDSGPENQTDLKGAMEEVVYTADAGYYFPEDYRAADVNGIHVTRDGYTQITVSGTPTADALMILDGPSAKNTPSAPTDLSDGIEKINNTTTAMEYSASAEAEEWITCQDGFTAVAAGTWYVRYKETDTQLAGPAAEITVTAPVYSIEVTPGSKDFGTMNPGYIQPAEQTITVNNTGNSPLTLTQPTSINYEISPLSELNIDAGASAAFTVRPKADLIAGTYNETIVVYTDKGNSAAVKLNFIVRDALSAVIDPASAEITEGQSLTLTVNPAGGSGNYTYQWYTGTEQTVISTDRTITVTPSADTTYTAVVTDRDEGTKAVATATVTVVPDTADEPKIIEGADSRWTKGDKKGLSFRSNADFKKFQRVIVDGKEIKASDYTIKEGSTYVTLKPEYLETLTTGVHTLGIASGNGTAETKFWVDEKAKPVPTQPQKDKTEGTKTDGAKAETAKTGDNSPILWWLVLMAISLAGAGGILIKRRGINCDKN